LLKEAKGRALIISAGSALRPLLMRNIKPDFFAIMTAGYNLQPDKGI